VNQLTAKESRSDMRQNVIAARRQLQRAALSPSFRLFRRHSIRPNGDRGHIAAAAFSYTLELQLTDGSKHLC